MEVLIVDSGPANCLLVIIVHLFTQRLISSYSADNNFLLPWSQILQRDSIGAQTSNKAHDVQIDLYFVGALFYKVVELWKLLILCPIATAAAQDWAKVQKVDKLREFQYGLVEFVSFDTSFLKKIFCLLRTWQIKQLICEQWLQSKSGKNENTEAKHSESGDTETTHITR